MQMCKDNKDLPPVAGHVSKGKTMISNRTVWLQAAGRVCRAAFLPALMPGLVIAQEAEETGLRIQAGASVQAIDNLFASTSDKVSDVITTGTLGISKRAAYGRQQFNLDGALNANEYARHKDWNYIGNRLNGGWQWSSGTGFHVSELQPC